MEVAPRVYLLKLGWANAVLLDGDKLVLVDTGMRGSARKILKFLQKLGRAPSDLDLIILTHHHPDHAGSLAELKRLTGARAAAGRADAPYISGQLPLPLPLTHRFLAWLLRPLRFLMKVEPAPVDLLLEDGQELDILGGLRVVHTPGHTGGSIALYSPAHKVLLAGDTFNNRFGRLSLANRSFSQDMA